MDTKHAFAKALRQTRKAQGLTQEDFSLVSSRTYLSLLERAQKSPTLEKINELAETLDVHPLTLLTLTYLHEKPRQKLGKLHDIIAMEIEQIRDSST